MKLNWKQLLSEERLRTSGGASNSRNAFESDYGRVIYSPAIRRMHDKTQVFPLSDDDNIHTRLTHSQEVMSLSYTFGIKLVNEIYNTNNIDITPDEFEFLANKDEDLRCTLLRTLPIILQTVSLFHDIGNTPFGHFGEDTISNYFVKNFYKKKGVTEELILKDEYQSLKENQINDFTEYDGNAQGLRVLTKLQILDDSYGLNLTYSILASYLKYPNKGAKIKQADIANKKHGVFYSEYKFFDQIIKNCGLQINKKIVRHPLCFLMEAADTIAYRTMDVEDGFNKGLYNVKFIIDKINNKIGDIEKESKLKKGIEAIEAIAFSDKVKMVKLRIILIDYLVDKAFSNFITNYNDIMSGEFQSELLDLDEFHLEEILKEICEEKIYDSDEVNTLEVTGNSVIKGLLDFYINALIHNDSGLEKKAYNMISKSIINTAILEDKINKAECEISNKHDISLFKFEDFKNLDVYYKLRVIIDFISGMTDKYALKHYQVISGHKLK
jgi:dGTPase